MTPPTPIFPQSPPAMADAPAGPLLASPIAYEPAQYRLPRHIIYIIAASAIAYGAVSLIPLTIYLATYHRRGVHFLLDWDFFLWLTEPASQAMLLVGGILLIQHRHRATFCLTLGALGSVLSQILFFHPSLRPPGSGWDHFVAMLLSIGDIASRMIYAATLLVLLFSPSFRRLLTGPRWRK
ncbi:MAG TPA: hypothetical protein VMD30_09170 [Tepidisphaeraceae bacterium]|nr:hypothetical protein [Tepidisphaeraceae bacterium]